MNEGLSTASTTGYVMLIAIRRQTLYNKCCVEIKQSGEPGARDFLARYHQHETLTIPWI